jgi:ABC-type nickel/cobalt efflux system permease component RcnA
MPDSEFLTVLGLGFLLGARHALDADHLAAVSTMIARRPEPRRSGLIGLWWGSGHTVVLLAVGIIVIALKVTIPDPVAQAFEFGIGAILIWLGTSLALMIWRERWHLHVHRHGEGAHAHLHSHQAAPDHEHEHWTQRSIRPFLVGMAHGLAGSAALTLMVLSTVRTVWEGVAYISVFGVGSIVAMAGLGVLLSLPLTVSASFGRFVPAVLQGCASVVSIGLGLTMMVRIALGP